MTTQPVLKLQPYGVEEMCILLLLLHALLLLVIATVVLLLPFISISVFK